MTKMTYYQVTHELLTPINSIMGMLEVLKTKIFDLEVLKYLKVCFCSAHQMLRSINEYQYLQKCLEGQIKPVFSRFECLQLLGDLREHFKFEAKEKGLKVKLDLTSLENAQRYRIHSDKERLK